ncbi:hypothetical protein ElyMa_002910100 [Elysia marginata]|uniref:Uncharacterized protein n=1 Tax=Elysia marginata TaxID=1093978 RepID=A0AAV4I6N4_9GAST|nr:hypothetical protein ElyMa_002910100 [Elysia marginata]
MLRHPAPCHLEKHSLYHVATTLLKISGKAVGSEASISRRRHNLRPSEPVLAAGKIFAGIDIPEFPGANFNPDTPANHLDEDRIRRACSRNLAPSIGQSMAPVTILENRRLQ